MLIAEVRQPTCSPTAQLSGVPDRRAIGVLLIGWQQTFSLPQPHGSELLVNRLQSVGFVYTAKLANWSYAMIVYMPMR